MRGVLLALFLVAGLSLPAVYPAFAGEEKSCTLKVEGMTCDACEKHVKKALDKVEGVKDAKVEVKAKKAIVTYDVEKTNPDAIAKAITDAGYEAKVEEKS
ncbi:MAG: heavy-metal-associated domain-containing protein [Nitrospirae bacterium]|nr:heavy-metal-associated domain-containing protein [Nitrospirota bacterium]